MTPQQETYLNQLKPIMAKGGWFVAELMLDKFPKGTDIQIMFASLYDIGVLERKKVKDIYWGGKRKLIRSKWAYSLKKENNA